MLLIGHLCAGGKISDHLQIALNWMQLHVGITYPLLQQPHTPLPHLPQNWFSCLHNCLAASHLHLELPAMYMVKPRHIHDYILIQDAVQACLPLGELEKINRVQLYYQVECLSDLCNIAGKQYYGQPVTISPKHWPKLPLPGPCTLQAWHYFLQTNYLKSDGITLHQELGL